MKLANPDHQWDVLANRFDLTADANRMKYKKYPVSLEPVGKAMPRKNQPRALGVTSGVGSLLIGAMAEGFKVVGNIEWRDYYRLVDGEGRNTFTANFPEAFFVRGMDDMDPLEFDGLKGVDLIMGHPECGKYSALNGSSKTFHEAKYDAQDIPLFVWYLHLLQPRFFVMDDLPDSFLAFPMEEYVKLLPGYDLFPEWISNYHYGNPQLKRERMFMIGARKEEGYTFEPGEFDSQMMVWDSIGDLEKKYSKEEDGWAHYPPNRTNFSMASNLRHRGDRISWGDLAKWIRTEWQPGKNITYHTREGDIKPRLSFMQMHQYRHAYVITGGNPHFHPTTGFPMTIRERARLQGFPDTFSFYGAKMQPGQTWDHVKDGVMKKQTGKAMPVQFGEYAAGHIMDHIRGRNKSRATMERYIKPNPKVNAAKEKFCELVGYSDQYRACLMCSGYNGCSLPIKEDE